MKSVKGRGRPLTFEPKVRRKLAKLVERHGASYVSKTSSIPISMGTLLKIAHEHGVVLKKGRRPKAA